MDILMMNKHEMVPTTDGHGLTRKHEIYSLVQCCSVQFGGQTIPTERGPSVGDMPTTDEHGLARKREI